MVHHWINYNMETVRKLYTNDTPHHDGSNKMLEFTGVILVINHKANLLDVDGDEVWIPHSLCDYFNEPKKGHEIDFEIPEWFATKKDLI